MAQPRHSIWLYAGIACLPAAYFLIFRRKRTQQQLETDFASFLKQPAAPATARGLHPHAKPSPTSFEAFLVQNNVARASQPTAPPPTSFEAFLVQRNVATIPNGTATSSCERCEDSASTTEADEALLDRVRVPVLFGTEYGFSKEVAESLSSKLLASGTFWPVLIDMGDCSESLDFGKEQVVCVTCSTQGDGVPPTEARPFCEAVFSGKVTGIQQKFFAVCALGDKSYTHFCQCGKMLDASLEQAGAVRLLDRVDVNREDWKSINTWQDALLDALLLLVCTSQLKTVRELGGTGSIVAVPSGQRHRGSTWSKARPYFARIVAVEPLCTVLDEDDKDTVRVEFELADSGLSYEPGDALGLWPDNDLQVVEEVLSLMCADGEEPLSRPAWLPAGVVTEAPGAAKDKVTLRDALLRAYDLRSPRPDLLRALLAAAPPAGAGKGDAGAAGRGDNGAANAYVSLNNGTLTNSNDTLTNGKANGNGVCAKATSPPLAAQVAALQALLDAGDDSAEQQQYFAERHVSDVLTDFPDCHLPWSKVLPCLRPLLPRLYSISSSPAECAARVAITVAVVRYSTRGRARGGVCSTWLAERLQVGTSAPLYIHPNPGFRLPSDPSLPLIMIGPGTGLAPFRAFILSRSLQPVGTGPGPGPMMLFFGCRRRDRDFLYGDWLLGQAERGELQLHLAFSREKGSKVYVQQRIREQGDAVWALLQQGAHVYVCGDAGSMAPAVEAALLDVIGARIDGGGVEAQHFFESLKAQQRYQRDVWLS